MTAPDAIREFVKTTAERLPTVDEVLALCDACGITFKLKEGEPCMTVPRENREVATIVQELIGREPWRSQVIERRISQERKSA